MGIAEKLNESFSENHLYMVIKNFTVVDEFDGVIELERYDVIMTIQTKVYANDTKYYMCKANDNTNRGFVIRANDDKLNSLININFIEKLSLTKLLGLILLDKSPRDLHEMTGLPLDKCDGIMADLVAEVMAARMEEPQTLK